MGTDDECVVLELLRNYSLGNLTSLQRLQTRVTILQILRTAFSLHAKSFTREGLTKEDWKKAGLDEEDDLESVAKKDAAEPSSVEELGESTLPYASSLEFQGFRALEPLDLWVANSWMCACFFFFFLVFQHQCIPVWNVEDKSMTMALDHHC